MKLSALYRMARKSLEIDPISGSLSFERLPTGTRLVHFDGQTVGAIRMARNNYGHRIWLGVNQRGWKIEGRDIRFLLRLMGLDV